MTPTPTWPRAVHDIPRWAYTTLPQHVAGLAQSSTQDLVAELASRLVENKDLASDRDLLATVFDLRCVLEVLTDVHANRYSRAFARDSVTQIVPLSARLRARFGAARELSLADIGCGPWNPLAVGFLSLMSGFDRAFAFDLDAPEHPERAVRLLAELAAAAVLDPKALLGADAPAAAELLQGLHGFDLAALARGDIAGLAPQRLSFARRNAGDLGLEDASIALVRSSAFLEHVTNVDEVLAEFARVTCPGGVGVHHIDAIDHRVYYASHHHGLDYLQLPVPGEIVDISMAGRSGMVQNRIRPQQWIARFEQHGFRVEHFAPIRLCRVDEAQRDRFVEPYRSMPLEQLAPTAADFLVVRA